MGKVNPADYGWGQLIWMAETHIVLFLSGSAILFLATLILAPLRAIAWSIFFAFGFTGALVTLAVVVGGWYATLKRLAAGGVCGYTANLAGKNVIITGANSGIGKAAALELARMGASIILACRSVSKAEAACEDLRKEARVDKAKVRAMELDLGSLKSVRAFAKAINDENLPVDILINNAGVMACPYSKTADGLEMQTGTNHFGHFLLTNLLLERIERCHGRVVNISSSAYFFAKGFDYDKISHPETYESWDAYAMSKLANALFAVELQKRFEKDGSRATAYCLHPGFVATELQRFQAGLDIGKRILPLFKTPREGCQTTLYCAIHPEAIPGLFYSDCKPSVMIPAVLNEAESRKLWELSEKLVGL